MLWVFLLPGVNLAAAVVVIERCHRLYCQVVRCRSTLADASPDHPAETPRP